MCEFCGNVLMVIGILMYLHMTKKVLNIQAERRSCKTEPKHLATLNIFCQCSVFLRWMSYIYHLEKRNWDKYPVMNLMMGEIFELMTLISSQDSNFLCSWNLWSELDISLCLSLNDFVCWTHNSILAQNRVN